jgi:hypothetical protein
MQDASKKLMSSVSFISRESSPLVLAAHGTTHTAVRPCPAVQVLETWLGFKTEDSIAAIWCK